MIRVPIHTNSSSYEAVIEPGVLARAGRILQELLGGVQPVFVVTVPPVRRRWGKQLHASLRAAGFAPKFVEMADGERHKRLATIEVLSEELLRLGADRKAVVLALGGGVVGDVA